MQQNVTDRLKRLIFDRLDFREPPNFTDATPLFNGGLGMDSFAAVELVSLIEAEFGIQFDIADLSAENFHDLAALARVIERYPLPS
jgi:acyl carrier protein